MKELRDVEYLPEPTDRSIVSAVDPTVIGFQNEWRSEIMGWAPREVTPVVKPRRRSFTLSGVVVFALLVSVSLLVWQNNWVVVEFQVPSSLLLLALLVVLEALHQVLDLLDLSFSVGVDNLGEILHEAEVSTHSIG